MFDQRITFLFNRLLGKQRYLNFEAASVETQQLAPSGVGVRPGAIMLDGALDKARQTHLPSTSLEFQKSVARGGEIEFLATEIYTLKNVIIEQTSVISKSASQSLAWKGTPSEILKGVGAPRRTLNSAFLVSSHQGVTYFGDWLFDNTARALIAQELGHPTIAVLGNIWVGILITRPLCRWLVSSEWPILLHAASRSTGTGTAVS